MPESPEPDPSNRPEQSLQVTGAVPSGSDGVVHDELAELVTAARSGDQAAFAQLVEATHRDTFTLAVRLTGNEEDARDVTQEAYLRAYRGLSRFRGDAQFSTWMYRITANCAATYLGRRNRHRHDPLPESAELIDLRSDVDPELRSDAVDLRDRLLLALDVLPPKLRAVVVLRDVYELSHDAIAEELGISATAAKVRLHRARHKLRSEVFPELDQVASRAV
jgi:RNA polymerase sigma-70 factor (ECF subfamily)